MRWCLVRCWPWRECPDHVNFAGFKICFRGLWTYLVVVRQVGNNFVLKLIAIDADTTTTRTLWIATLNHEPRNDAVEDDIIVLARGGQSREVQAGLGRLLGEESDGDVAEGSVDHDALWVLAVLLTGGRGAFGRER